MAQQNPNTMKQSSSEPLEEKPTNEKNVYWLVSSNYDLSNHVPDFQTAMELIEGDFDCQDEEGKIEVEYTIKPVWMTEDEYEQLPEAD